MIDEDEKEKKKDSSGVLIARFMTGLLFLISATYFWQATYDSPNSTIYSRKGGGKDETTQWIASKIGESSIELLTGVFWLSLGLYFLAIIWRASASAEQES
jgi:hypothetical protein